MLISKISILSGKSHVREIPVTEEQLNKWQGGMLIQSAMPEVSAEDREFLISGITPEEWESTFGGDE